MSEAITSAALDSLFTGARTHNGWLDIPVSDETLREIYDLMKWGPTSANCSPARIVFVRSAEGKEKLRPALSSGNLEKTLTAPVTAIVAWDTEFYERLPELFPHGDAKSWFTTSPAHAEETPFATAPCRPLISSLPVAPWGWTPARCPVLTGKKSTKPFSPARC